MPSFARITNLKAMKYIFLIAMLVTTAPILSLGKGIKLNLQSGMGSYSMTDLKTLNEMAFNAFPLPVKQTANFPVYWYYQGSIQFPLSENFDLGPMYAFHSTGSRYSLADYSGEYSFDNLIHAHTLGLAINYKLLVQNNFAFAAYADGGIGFSKLEMAEGLDLTEVETTETDETTYKSTGYFVEPGFSFSYTFKFLEPGIRFGYHIPLAEGDFKNTKNEDLLFLRDGSKVKSGWGGIRLGVSLSFYFSK